MTDTRKTAIETLKQEAEAIAGLIPLLNDDFDKAVDLIHHSKGRLIITGVGKSGHIGAKIAATLASTGTPSFFINPLDAFHGDLGMITPDDIVLAISYSGQTDELLRFIPFLIERKVPLIGMSGNPKSLLAQYSTCHLNVAVKKEACPLNLAPTSSTTATLAMGDAIACALMQVRGFQTQDFAQFHPGGSLGKRLLMRVKDIMRTENLPVVSPETKISNVLLEISKGRICMALIIDRDKLIGIVSDGDVRRAMQNYKNMIFDISVNEIMNTNPIKISSLDKLTLAETLFKEHNIHTLVVVDDEKFIGILEAYKCI